MTDTRSSRNDPLGAPIIRAERAAAWYESQEVLQRAREQAAQAQAQASAAAEAARREGWQAGFEAGRQAGAQAAAQLALQTAAARERYLQTLVPGLQAALLQALRQILDDLDAAALVAGAARRAVADLRAGNTATLRVPMALRDTVQARLAPFDSEALVLRGDAALDGTQCFLDTPLGTIALSPHTQWERLREALQDPGAEA